jgi:hypothetical protein
MQVDRKAVREEVSANMNGRVAPTIAFYVGGR